MKVENDYPIIYKKINLFLKVRRIILFLLLIALLVSVIINLSIGGRWCIYVLGGEVISYYAFLNKPLIDNVLLKRIVILFLVIMMYLYIIDKVNMTNWSSLVIDILIFSLLIIELLFFFIHYRYYKNKIIILFFTAIFSCLLCLLGIIGVIRINWALIVTGSLGLFILIILFSFYFKITIKEIKKYFSMK